MLGPEGFAEQELARVLDELDETLWSVAVEPGPRFRYVSVSGKLTRVPGAERSVFLGKYVDEVLLPDAAAVAVTMLTRALESGTEQRFDTTYDGTLGHQVHHNVVYPNDDRTLIIGISRDVTTERAALERLESRDSLNRSVLDSIPASTAVIDDRGVVRLINAAWLAEAVDLERNVALPGDDLVASLRHIPGADLGVRFVLDGDRRSYETDYLDDGRWFNLRVVPFDLNGERGAVVSRTDVTQRVNEQQLIEELNERWQLAFDTAPIGMALMDPDSRFVLVNPKLCQLVGRTEDDLIGRDIREVTIASDLGRSVEELVGRGADGLELRLRRPNGSTLWASVTWSTLGEAFDKPHYFIQLQDISAHKRAQARLADHHRLLELVASGASLEHVLATVAEVGERHLEGSRFIVAATGEHGWSESVTAVGLDGVPSAEIDETYRAFAPIRWHEPPGVIIVPDDGGSPLGAAVGIGGAWTVPILTNADVVSGFLVVRDPPEEQSTEDVSLLEQLGSVVRIAIERDAATRRIAEHLLEDPLTGLPSRTLFHRRLEQAIARIGHGSRGVAVINADLDRFGRINESLGYVAGDEVLVQTAGRVRALLPAPDTVARGGGDEFLVLVEDVPSVAAATAVAERVLEGLRAPLQIGDVEFECPASAGVVFLGEWVDDIDAIESDASLAMAAAKARGRDCIEVYNPELRRTLPLLSLERDLRRAVANDEFVVYFQPEVALETNQVVGVEALVRWAHPERGLLLPTEFMPAAEDSGVIVDIGREVLLQSCARLAEWSAITDVPLTVSVNLSIRQLSDPGLIAFTAATLERFGLEPSRLVLEITERTLIDDGERASEVFNALRDLGVGVSIDDFGTGYSSLLYLKRFPADMLKIDRSFVAGLGESAGDSAIVTAVVHLAHQLDLRVIAEGVETPEQVAHLRRLGCEEGQGYLWATPLAADDLAALLRAPLPDIPDVPVEPVAATATERRELDEMLAVLTHELSTPLTVIGGYAEMLADRLDEDANARSGVAAIERNVHNLGRLVAALADARGPGTLGETERFDAGPFLEQVLHEQLPLLGGHQVSWQIPERGVLVDADPAGLRQIISNLVSNAVKFTPTDGRIEIDAHACDQALMVRVVDHGEGVPSERVDELFGRFARLGSTRRGLGLGLYLARAIARRQGGDVTYEPTPGGGATFVVTVPLASDPEGK